METKMMRMSSKILFGQNAVDWQERINVARMREERAERARQVMRENNIAALLATREHNCRYLTGLRGPEWMPQLWYVLFFAEGDPVVFSHAGWHIQMPDQAPWIKEWRIGRAWLRGGAGPEATKEEIDLFAEGILRELKHRKLESEKLAIVGFDNRTKNVLSERGRMEITDGWPLMMEATKIKTKDEVLCLKTVASICEAGWYSIWENLRPGIRDTDLSLCAINALYKAGADFVPPTGIYSGPLTSHRGFNRTGRIIQTGDLVHSSMCNVSFMGYKSCTFRTLIAGRKANTKEKDMYKKLLERINSVINCINPGSTTADAAKKFPTAKSFGYKEEAELLTVEIGHGIGLFAYGPPIINRQWSIEHPQVFESGMTLAVEGMEGNFREGGVRLENMILVTDDGAEIMDHMPRDQILEPPVSRCWL